jgi:hypothetical protein
MTTNHARYNAAVSIISGGRNDARAAGAKARTAAANPARGNLRILFTTEITNICAYSQDGDGCHRILPLGPGAPRYLANVRTALLPHLIPALAPNATSDPV